MKRVSCLCCGSGALQPILNLGMHPFADSFYSDEDTYRGIVFFPLGCVLCNNCKLVQTVCQTNAALRYQGVDYAYNSENSALAKKHWTSFVEHHLAWGLSADDFVVEIGSNDGYLLSLFRDLGYAVLGVDPAKTQSAIARSRGLRIIEEIFTSATVDQIVAESGDKAKLVVANNVFNHSDDPIDFLKGVKNLLHIDGRAVIEVPYWGSLVMDGKFEQIYHEHVTYLTVTNMARLLERTGLRLIDVALVDYHGGSLRFIVSHVANSLSSNHSVINSLLQDEKKKMLNDAQPYDNLQSRINSQRTRLLEALASRKRDGYTVGALGAAAKGNTILNWLGAERGLIDFVLDSSPHKIGKKTPGTGIDIFEDNKIKGIDKLVLLELAWNISTVLRDKILEINPNAEFIGVDIENN